MALRDLQSDLTNLDFGKGTAFDRPNQGFSSQPFVKRTINYDNSIDSLTDGLVRGGILTATERSLQDVKRITKFLLTSQGLGFLTKQTGLQLSNPQIRPNGLFTNFKSNQRTYNLGVNTLASIAGSAAGIRFKREGLIPLSDPTKFEGYVSDLEFTREDENSPGRGINNRLINLFKGHISLEEEVQDENKLFEYNGGPDSIYGLGQTTIKKYKDVFTTDKEIPSELKAKRDIGGKDLTLSHDPLNTKKQKSKYTKGITSYHVSYNGESDAVNLKEIQKDQSAYNGNDDFIPFRFEAVNTNDPLKSDYIIFRAFLDSFNDNYNANHNEFNYNGRGETFYTYNGFKRNIDFAFKIAAQSKEEILPLYTKLNYLVSNVAPEYGLATLGGRMRTPYIKLTVGDWCNRVPGILNSIGLTWQKDYPWQIENSDNILMLPHVLDVNVQFTPIHNFLPEKSIDSQFFNLKGADA